ncbi:multidrug transporter, partial [Pseudomonas syringae pv. actinidifoliorum]|nr:multidrug transporter [Pseudomonas syringae pv. actinidifoliorum]
MSPFRIFAATLALFIGLQALPAVAADITEGSGDPVYTIQNPPAFAMIGDLLIARPLLIGATIIGTGLFVIAAP